MLEERYLKNDRGKPCVSIAYNKCPRGHSYHSLSVEDRHGGTRLTEGKCCGSWTVIKSWLFNEEQLRRMASELLSEADNLSKAEQEVAEVAIGKEG